MANEQAKAFIDQATQSLQNSQFQQALELVDQAIAIDPGTSDSHVLRGICLSQLGQPDAATEAFRKAIMLSPYNAKAYYNLAVHQNALGNKKEAHELAREAVGVDPRHTAARQFLNQLEQELSAPPPVPSGVRSSDLDPIVGAVPPPTPVDRPGSSVVETPKQAEQGPPRQSAANPYAATPPVASQFSSGGYARPGYDQSAHSLPWIENMGSGWTTIGWVLSVVSLVLLAVAVVIGYSAIQEFVSSGGHGPTTALTANFGFLSPVGIIGILVRILCLVWMLCDVVDRRSGWGWVVALAILGCCCGLPWIIVPIYILGGRK